MTTSNVQGDQHSRVEGENIRAGTSGCGIVPIETEDTTPPKAPKAPEIMNSFSSN